MIVRRVLDEKLRVLHIDDDEDVRRVVSFVLGKQQDLEIRSCDSGRAGLKLATAWSPHLVLCDLRMPDMDGSAILEQMRKCSATAETPFALMTATRSESLIGQLRCLEGCAIISKPFTPSGLCDAVRKLLPKRSGAIDMLPHEISAERAAFCSRLRSDAAELGRLRTELDADPASEAHLRDMRTVAHKLAGAAGSFGYPRIGQAASALEDAIAESLLGGSQLGLHASLERLTSIINVSSRWPQ